MSQADLSNFSWPTAAPGAPNLPKFSLDLMATGSPIATSYKPLVTQPIGTDVSYSAKTVHTTVTSTMLHNPAADTSTASLVHQIKPLELQPPIISTKYRTQVPEVTVAAFEPYTPSADPPVSIVAEATATNWNSGLTPIPLSSHSSAAASSSALSSTAIAGIATGCVTFTTILILLALLLYRRRMRKAIEPAPVDMESVLEAKRQRAHDLGMLRWSQRNTRASMERFRESVAGTAAKDAASKEEAIVEEVESKVFVVDEEIQEPQVQYDRARRPSGLAMHPPTPATAEFKAGEGKDIGQAI